MAFDFRKLLRLPENRIERVALGEAEIDARWADYGRKVHGRLNRQKFIHAVMMLSLRAANPRDLGEKIKHYIETGEIK
jgi:hypothetical protein